MHKLIERLGEIVNSRKSVYCHQSLWDFLQIYNMAILHEKFNTISIKTFFKVVELKAGQTFGELALINKQLRAARIVTSDLTFLAFLDRHEFSRIREQSIRQDVADKVLFIREIPLFYHLNHQCREKIAIALGKSKTILRGMNLFTEGDKKIDGVYLIHKGEFEVVKTINFEGLNQQQQ